VRHILSLAIFWWKLVRGGRRKWQRISCDALRGFCISECLTVMNWRGLAATGRKGRNGAVREGSLLPVLDHERKINTLAKATGSDEIKHNSPPIFSFLTDRRRPYTFGAASQCWR
jgi:hypothetical protein